MIESSAPVTLYKTSSSGILPTGAVGKGRLENEVWSQTTYPNGTVVTRIYYNEIEIYDSNAVITKHNQPNQIDIMV